MNDVQYLTVSGWLNSFPLLATAYDLKERLCMGSFDDGYETKIETRPGEIGVDLPTLLLLLDSDDF